ncbi:MAG: hypothetical protein KO202_01810 [Methanobacteriaceae archaeon]|jgi:hypothetical protein|nr:hypothetical protein [Methanobacteriaceae archaeon]
MKIKYIIATLIVIIIVIAGGILAYDHFTGDLGIINKKVTSSFDNAFMSGTFMGTVNEAEVNNSDEGLDQWLANYKDEENNIEYNMSTCKNASFLLEYLSLQGLSGPETREYGGTEWNIYYSEGAPTTQNGSDGNTSNNASNASSQNITYDIYICEANKDNQSYLIYIINPKTEGIVSPVESDGSLYCELFTDYIQPLLENTEFKHNDNVPEVYDLLGISEGEYTQLSDFIEKYKAGEVDAEGNTISN